MKTLGAYAAINAKGGFSPAEALAWHEPLLNRRGGDYDPRVRIRIERGREMSAVEYIRLLAARRDFIRRIAAEAASVDALVMPTLPVVAPPIAAFAKDEDFWRINAKILRNTSIINFLDRCALTIPIERKGEAPVGLMLVEDHGRDQRLMAIGLSVEAALAPLRVG
jgi:aspartyl-tRNA(Asn)/glutamyl-tRNA(Gln) amidotransferase subunit A